MTLDSAIKYKDFSNPSIVRTRPIHIQMGADGKAGFAGPIAAVQLKLTKPLTVTNAQGKNEIKEVGTVIYAIPMQNIAASNSYLYETDNRVYILTIGVNAELYNEALDNKKKKGGAIMLVGFALIAYVVYKIIGSK